MCVVTSVKPSALKRLQAATMGDVIGNIEEIRTAKMGRTPSMTCLVQVGNEALIMVRSLLPGRQFSVLVRGTNQPILSTIQKCLHHLILQSYQAMCEMAYFGTMGRNRISSTTKRETPCTCEDLTGSFTKELRLISFTFVNYYFYFSR